MSKKKKQDITEETLTEVKEEIAVPKVPQFPQEKGLSKSVPGPKRLTNIPRR